MVSSNCGILRLPTFGLFEFATCNIAPSLQLCYLQTESAAPKTLEKTNVTQSLERLHTPAICCQGYLAAYNECEFFDFDILVIYNFKSAYLKFY